MRSGSEENNLYLKYVKYLELEIYLNVVSTFLKASGIHFIFTKMSSEIKKNKANT